MGARILVADDSVTIQKVVELTFSKEDFQIVPARSGEEAIRKAREVRPDLMLIDLVMPDKSGYEVCETLRKDPILKDVPIILLTGTFEAFDKNEGARVGANDFVTKPFESQILIGKVKQLLFARSMAAPPRPASPSPATAPALASPGPPPPPPPVRGPVFGLERGGPAPAPPAPSVAPAAAGAGEAEVSEEKLWELLEREEPWPKPTYVLPEETGPSLKLGPPVEEGLPMAPRVPEGERVFSLDEGTDIAASLKEMAASLGLPAEGPPVDLEAVAPVPRRSPKAEPPPPEPAEDLTIPLLDSLDILQEEEPAPAPLAPPAPVPPAAAPPPRPASFPQADADRLTREITEKVARALVQEVSERLAGKIERIVWEVVPDLAEHLITQEIDRIRAQAEGPPEKA
jgi:CheY-like chemotaxis protein